MGKVIGLSLSGFMVALGFMLNPPSLDWASLNTGLPFVMWRLFLVFIVAIIGFAMYACVNDARGD